MAIPAVEGTLGHAIPPYQRHAIVTHFPFWQSMLDFIDRKPEFMSRIKTIYPRLKPHSDVEEVANHICRVAHVPETKMCLLYPTLLDAQYQVEFSSSAKRREAQVGRSEMDIRAFDIDVRYYAVFFDTPNLPKLMTFWKNAGVGVTSRRAEESLKHIDKLKEVSLDSEPLTDSDTPARQILQHRIAELLERATVGHENKRVRPDEIYFYQCGMAAIFWVNDYLKRSTRSGTTVMYGYGFECTPHTLEDFSKSWKIFKRGSERDLDDLEHWLVQEKSAGRPVQAIWAEFPANPMLTTPDLNRLRKLADDFDTLLIVDDTLASFCNVDVMGADGADIVITSLSKSFSGYADLLMGSAVINPLSRAHDELRLLFERSYTNDVCPADLDALERNSRNYLERSTISNQNAAALVKYLQTQAEDPDSSVATVMYPSVHPQKANYDARMRSKTAEFTPGYGCVFSVQFEDVPYTIAFYDELSKYTHIGPHLGAHKTLALAYVKGLYGKQLEYAKEFGLDERAIRVSAGFEDTPKRLVEIFRTAVEAADQVKRSMSNSSQALNSVTSVN